MPFAGLHFFNTGNLWFGLLASPFCCEARAWFLLLILRGYAVGLAGLGLHTRWAVVPVCLAEWDVSCGAELLQISWPTRFCLRAGVRVGRRCCYIICCWPAALYCFLARVKNAAWADEKNIAGSVALLLSALLVLCLFASGKGLAAHDAREAFYQLTLLDVGRVMRAGFRRRLQCADLTAVAGPP